MSYSLPVKKKMMLADLRPHLFTLRSIPNGFRTELLITSRTGVFVFDTQIERLLDDEYEVVIDLRVFGLVHLRMASFMYRVKFLMRFSSRVMCAILLCATTICQVLRWP